MKISKRMKYTFLSGALFSIPAHLFALTNVLQNYDNISQTPEGVGTGITSGRWVLELSRRFHEKYGINYNMPMLNGLLTLLLLIGAACLIMEILDVKSLVLCCAFAGVFSCFPTVTSNLFFMYTAHYNAFAVFLAVLMVWLFRCCPKKLWGIIGAAICCAVSLGIYQAYFPMAACLFVILLIKESLQKNAEWKKLLIHAFSDFGMLVLGAAVYYVVLQGLLKYYGLELSGYQGINNMGHLTLTGLPGLLKRTWLEIVRLPFADYYGISSTVIIRTVFALLAVFTLLVVGYLLAVERPKALLTVSCLVLLMVFPLAVNGITIMCPESGIYTLMVYGAVFLFVLPVMLTDMLLERHAGKISCWAKKALPALLLVASLQYIWLSNGNYMAAYYNTEQSKDYLSSMLTQARMTKGFRAELPWAFIGNVSDETFKNPWQDTGKFIYGGNGATGEKPLVNFYSRKSWFWHYMGYDMQLVDNDMLRRLKRNPRIKEMPCYPDYGSIRIYRDMVVVKLSD